MKNFYLIRNSFFGIVLIIVGCQNSESGTTNFIKTKLSDLEQIKSATYKATEKVFMPGDSAVFSESKFFYKEYSNPADTLVSCVFVKLDYNDTTKMDFLYNGMIRARVDWENEYFETDDFSKNPYPFRPIYLPFITRAKSILKFALESPDSTTIAINEGKEHIHFSLEIHDKIVEFVGAIPNYEQPFGAYDFLVSRYEIWFDKTTNLPFRIIRDLPHNKFDETIEDITINEIDINTFIASDYFPLNFNAPSNVDVNPNESLIGMIAPDLYLKNINDDGGFKKEEIKNGVTLIVFTSINCGVCHNAIPFLKQLKDEYDEKEFQLLSIEYSNINPTVLQTFKTRNSINYEMYLTNEETKENFKSSFIPSFYILNRKNEISKIISGFSKEESEPLIKSTIDALL